MALIRICDDIVYREVDGSVVTLSLTTGAYVTLDSVGSVIWHLIEQDGRRSSVRRSLLNEFDLDEQTCDEELDAFLERLAEKQLVTVSVDEQ